MVEVPDVKSFRCLKVAFSSASAPIESRVQALTQPTQAFGFLSLLSLFGSHVASITISICEIT